MQAAAHQRRDNVAPVPARRPRRLRDNVELVLAGADADAGVPGMAAHVEGCPACAEDHGSLMALVTNEPVRHSDEFRPARGSSAQHSTPRRTS